MALLSGEPGIGKTRLAAEIARFAYDEGATVLFGRCDDELGVPYQPFVEALAFVVEQYDPEPFTAAMGRHAGELTRLFPGLAEHVPDLPAPMNADPETAQYRLFDAVTGALRAGAAARPILFVIDDLHWAAKPTLLMLRHVAATVDPARLLIVGTYRDTDLYRAHPLTEVLADLRRLDGVERLSLTGLEATQVIELLERIAGHDLDDNGRALARMIHDETEGNRCSRARCSGTFVTPARSSSTTAAGSRAATSARSASPMACARSSGVASTDCRRPPTRRCSWPP